MAISVKLEVFEGPLDLLLHLIDKKQAIQMNEWLYGADYETRTRHLHLGKVALYRMS